MNNILPGKTSYAPQSATSNSPVTIAARVAYFDTPHFDISAYFDAHQALSGQVPTRGATIFLLRMRALPRNFLQWFSAMASLAPTD